MIISARLLSGKFESDDIIWKTFSEEYGKVNTVYTDHDVDVSAENHPPQRTAVWSREINGIICEVETQQPDINEDAEYIKIIRLIEK
ncbi:MAG: hypothetical protein E7218_07755 [Anaerofustis stercorihominis]|nr:hypothetical protein [Anaerofustis stercorihominis]